MDERRITGQATEPQSPRENGKPSESGETNGHADGLATVEPWTPPAAGERASTAIRRYLTAGESLQHVDAVTQIDGAERPASVGVTDERLLVVGEDGGFVGVGLDRVCTVRSDVESSSTVRGTDYRALLAVGYLLGVVGFLGVLASAASPLTPTLALVALGGVFATDHVLREGADFDALVAAIGRHDRDTGLADRLERGKRRVNDRVADDDVALGGAVGLAVGTFLLMALLEGSPFPPVYTALVVGGAGLTVYAMRHSDRFDGFELVRRRQRTVRATVDDGSVVAMRTHPNSRLDQELAGSASGPTRPDRPDSSGP